MPKLNFFTIYTALATLLCLVPLSKTLPVGVGSSRRTAIDHRPALLSRDDGDAKDKSTLTMTLYIVLGLALLILCAAIVVALKRAPFAFMKRGVSHSPQLPSPVRRSTTSGGNNLLAQNLTRVQSSSSDATTVVATEEYKKDVLPHLPSPPPPALAFGRSKVDCS